MLAYLILGLLRDGQPRHGYQLVTQYRALTGMTISPGNVYRELSRLAAKTLIRARSDEAGGDSRRIPYHLTDAGCQTFDQWLFSVAKQDDEFDAWLVFLDRVPIELRDRVLDRLRDTLWSRAKALERGCEDAAAKHATGGGYHPLPVLRQ
jgi:DNA-binding PadR family transcriptional regulator